MGEREGAMGAKEGEGEGEEGRERRRVLRRSRAVRGPWTIRPARNGSERFFEW